MKRSAPQTTLARPWALPQVVPPGLAVPPLPVVQHVKILLLCHRLPWPLHDGYNLHNHHYVQQLSGQHQFHLVAVDRGELPQEARERFASVTVLEPRLERVQRSLGGRLATALSVEHVFDCDPAVLGAAARVIARHGPFDLIWTSGAKMLVYSQRLAGKRLPVLGDIADEASGEALHDLRRARGPLALARALKNLVNTWRFQKKYLTHTPICTVVSESDQAMLARNCPGLDVRVTPNGVDADVFRPMGTAPLPNSLVFEGSMGFAPNAEGITTFIRETLPLIRARVPDVTLTAVGKDPTPELLALAGPGVEVTGFVDDVRPYVDRASVFVCPLRRGAGIKNKILQAWAMQKAVVATPVSCGGLVLQPGLNLQVAESPSELADAICALLADPDRRAALGAAGRATVMEHYSWQVAAARMDGILGELVGASRPAAVVA